MLGTRSPLGKKSPIRHAFRPAGTVKISAGALILGQQWSGKALDMQACEPQAFRIACCAGAANTRAAKWQQEDGQRATSEEGTSAAREGDDHVAGFGTADTSAFAALLNVRHPLFHVLQNTLWTALYT